jgi:hypothetical protein
MPKVLISDKLSPRAAAIFEEHGIDVDVKPGLSPDELKALLPIMMGWRSVRRPRLRLIF